MYAIDCAHAPSRVEETTWRRVLGVLRGRVMRPRILVVDDEPSIRKVLHAQLTREGYEVDAAADGAAAIERLAAAPWNLVVSDLRMPGIGGLELLAHVQTHHPGLPVIVITAHGTVDTAIEALKLGAQDFITKPFDLAEMRAAIEKALGAERARRGSLVEDPSWVGPRGRFDLVGMSPSMQRIYGLVEKVADSPTSVLLLGERGTGKELVARALHEQSSRRGHPFIVAHCGAIPDAHFESELFGHEEGAVPGAPTARPGRFELAHGGTLVLDDVGALPRELQVRVLRTLQEGKVERIGSTRAVQVDVRIVASTHVDLAAAVAAGRFREDLYYRLNVIQLRLPALRERREDIPLLVHHFLTRFNARLGKTVTSVTPAAMAALVAWNWPGNLRELENVIERAVLLSDAATLDLDVLEGLTAPPSASAEIGPVGLKDYVRVHTAKVERALIVRVLEAEQGNVTRAARRLDISRKGLQLKMKEYGLREDDDEG